MGNYNQRYHHIGIVRDKDGSKIISLPGMSSLKCSSGMVLAFIEDLMEVDKRVSTGVVSDGLTGSMIESLIDDVSDSIVGCIGTEREGEGLTESDVFDETDDILAREDQKLPSFLVKGGGLEADAPGLYMIFGEEEVLLLTLLAAGGFTLDVSTFHNLPNAPPQVLAGLAGVF